MAFLYGVLGFTLCLLVFGAGFLVGSRLRTPAAVTKPAEKEPDEAELRRIQREREELEAEQRAFRALTGYSADVAYGLTDFPTGDKGS